MRYRNDSLMSTEVPEPGWALVMVESPREGLGKNYMQQNQYLRYLSTSMSLPANLVRRRTMVEALYGLIVGRTGPRSALPAGDPGLDFIDARQERLHLRLLSRGGHSRPGSFTRHTP